MAAHLRRQLSQNAVRFSPIVCKNIYFSTLCPRAIAYHKQEAKGRPLPPQLNCARYAQRAEHGLSRTFRFRFAGDCRKLASRAVAGELIDESPLWATTVARASFKRL
jgi:hypothetical protein